MHRLLPCLLVLALCMGLGCSETPPATEKTSEQSVKSSPIIGTEVDRESFAGKWALVTYQRPGGQLIPKPVSIALLEVEEREPSDFEVKLLQTANADELETLRPGAALSVKTARFDGDLAHIELELQGSIIDFQGEFQGNLVRGTAAIGQSLFLPADLVATNLDSLGIPESLPDVMAYEDALQSVDRVENLLEFAREHPDNPLALEAMLQAVREIAENGESLEPLRDAILEYREVGRRWGDRMEDMVVLRVAASLPQTGLAPELALEYVNEALERLNDMPAQELKPMLLEQRTLARVHLHAEALKSEDEAARQAASESLRSMLSEDPLNFHARFVLANDAAARGRTEEALTLYAQLAALPQVDGLLGSMSTFDEMALPRAQVERLWKEQHGNLDGLEDWLDELFEQQIAALAESSGVFDDGVPQTGQTVLVELFTGGSCAPCVAADLALAGLEHVVPTQTMIGVRYHEHIPAPDPLANAYSEARFDYYRNRGTPTICINGVPGSQFAGSVNRGRESLQQLAEAVGEQALAEPRVQIEAAAALQDGTLTLSARVTVPELPDPGWRLRMLLVQQELAFHANNGVRLHHNVVRGMPGGVDGIQPEGNTLEFQTTLPLASVREELEQYLKTFENGTGYKFRRKSLELGALQLVAFVQDEATRRILQSVIVPVRETATPEAEPSAGGQPANGQADGEGEKPDGEDSASSESAQPEEGRDSEAEQSAESEESDADSADARDAQPGAGE